MGLLCDFPSFSEPHHSYGANTELGIGELRTQSWAWGGKGGITDRGKERGPGEGKGVSRTGGRNLVSSPGWRGEMGEGQSFLLLLCGPENL
jgi:hypothetical protein